MAGTVLYENAGARRDADAQPPGAAQHDHAGADRRPARGARGGAGRRPDVRAIRLRGAGRAFCAGYDIGWGAEVMDEAEGDRPWDPIADQRMMSRFVDAYMSLWRSPKPVIAQVHGFCVGGGTDFALCSDLIVCAEDCRIGYPPARVWGSPTTAMWTYRLGLERSKRLLLTGDPLDGRTRGRVGARERVPSRGRARRRGAGAGAAASRSCPPTSCR